MAEAIGTAASIAGLVGAAFTIIQQIREAWAKVKASSTTLDGISTRLQSVEDLLRLIASENDLQTAGVVKQIKIVIDASGKLRLFFERLLPQQHKKPLPQFMHMIKSGDAEDKELQNLSNQLDRAKQDLSLQILVAQVGVMGDMREGFQVAFDVLNQTNSRVKEVLGTDLALMDMIRTRLPDLPVRTIAINADDLASLDAMGSLSGGSAKITNHTQESFICGNITQGQTRIMTGNLGSEQFQKTVGRKSTVSNNRFEKDVRIMTGNQTGEAAATFNQDFWN